MRSIYIHFKKYSLIYYYETDVSLLFPQRCWNVVTTLNSLGVNFVKFIKKTLWQRFTDVVAVLCLHVLSFLRCDNDAATWFPNMTRLQLIHHVVTTLCVCWEDIVVFYRSMCHVPVFFPLFHIPYFYWHSAITSYYMHELLLVQFSLLTSYIDNIWL